MKKLFLIDAYAIIYRAYYALLNNIRFTNKDGVNTAPVYGFLNTLHEVISKENPTHMAVAFDTGKTFRHEEYEQYKAQREKTPEDITAAIPFIKKLVRAYNIPVIEAPGYEADDIIASVARNAEAQGFDSYMLTPDKDYCQLVDDHCFLYRPVHGGGYEIMGVEEVKKKYGFDDPKQMIDYLGLVGDKSDNIPGCPGVGEKTAGTLLKQFGTIDNLYANINEVKGAIQGKLSAYEDQVRLSRRLATIKTDLDLPFDENALALKDPDLPALNAILDELEMKSQQKKINSYYKKNQLPAQSEEISLFDMEDFVPKDEPSIAKNVKLQSLQNYPHDFHILQSPGQVESFFNKLAEQKEFCFETETSSSDVFSCDLLGIAFSWKNSEAWFLPIDSFNHDLYVEKLRPFFSDPGIKKISNDIKKSYSVLKIQGIVLSGWLFDNTIAHYLLQAESRHDLAALAELYLGYEPAGLEKIAGPAGKRQKSLKDVALPDLATFACENTETGFRLYKTLRDRLGTAGVESLFYNVEMPLSICLADMEMAGVRIDSDALRAYSATLGKEAARIESLIYGYAGEELNINSPKQVGELLFDKLQLSGKAKKTRNGQYSTSEEILESLKGRHPVISLLLDYRRIKKLLSTYVDALPSLINPVTGKIHTSYNQTVTATGRLSSANPNLQNIPVREDMGREIRQAFVPDNGCIFLSADYSQIELRLMAHLSGDEHMCDAFKSGKDIHAATAAKIYKMPLDKITKDMRRKAKTANFGIIYGITAFGLAERLTIGREEAKQLIDGYFESYPKIKQFIDNCILSAREKGYAETILHRKRYLPDISSANSVVRKFAERNAVNAPIQGSAADIIKIAMVNIHRKMKEAGLRSQMILQVHDELDFNVYPDELESVKEIVRDGMENAVKLSVPLVADCGTGKNWLESH